jgi:uncharacterized protein (TIGR03083 family)
MIELMFAFDAPVVIGDATKRVTAAVAASPGAPVPSCPGWTVADLAQHLGYVQRFMANAISLRGAEPPEEDEAIRPDDLVTWSADSAALLLDAIRATTYEAPAWTWWGEPATVGGVTRHQVQEALVHCWDAEAATGQPRPLEQDAADDGVGEFLAIMLGPAEAAALPGQVALASLDTGNIWHAGPGDPGSPGVIVRGTASDLVLLLYRRIGLDAVEVVGDRALAAALVAAAETQ